MKEGNLCYLAPIAIDLGATHTGVYSALYQSGSTPDKVDREGTVYTLAKDAYTLLMDSRTQKRHQRRGYDRRQMAKRLFKLIWEKELALDWDADISKVAGFLFNRRGFTFLSEEYSREIFSQFPTVLVCELPDEVRKDFLESNGSEIIDMNKVIQKWIDESRIEEIFGFLENKITPIRKELVFYDRTRKLKDYCSQIKGNEPKAAKKLEKTFARIPVWILEKWREVGVKGLPIVPEKKRPVDLVSFFKDNPQILDTVIDTIPDYSEAEVKAKESVWNIKYESINLEKMDFQKNESHLIHFMYALYSLRNEMQSGARHRRKYFQEVSSVLCEESHKEKYLKRFCKKLNSGEFNGLGKCELAHIISHISNLEIKPLRKYFNDKGHSNGDYWDIKRFERVYSNWLLKEWRVDVFNNPEKGSGKEQDYGALCRRWKERSGSVLDFWKKENPVQTIPPYQNNNNRRPPRCQSLILNPSFLDEKYPDWQTWVKVLKKIKRDHLGVYEDTLRGLRTSKGNSYFLDDEEFTEDFQRDSQKLGRKDLDARVLQFILDQRKQDDLCLLNEIYSRAKKIRQLNNQESDISEYRSKLEKAISSSKLPEEMKTKGDFARYEIFPPGTFLHFICRYYKLRQRARDGRLFFHPQYKGMESGKHKRTNRFETKQHLLTYCNHKTRQKKYQSFSDVAGVLQVKPAILESKIGSKDDTALQNWLEGFKEGRKGLKGLCSDAAKAQKDHRGNLKRLIDAGKDKKLNALKMSIDGISKKISVDLWGNEGEKRAQKFNSVFSFAQLHNIVFTERSGNSNTCPICSADNSCRMESVIKGKEISAKAQRLPAIPTRIIDGAVMKMTKIVATRIVQDRWPSIKEVLEKNTSIRIPIITESNRFEFEPQLQELKSKKKPLDRTEPQFQDKVTRIRKSGKELCPYTGKSLGEDGELDHIIPRASKWGILNDEANLIYASREGNNKKLNRTYTLDDLSNAYKDAVFGIKDTKKIEELIKKDIWDGVGEKFIFGSYRSFINLTSEQQRGFRHALFLPETNPLRKKVIEALNNKRRTYVNGTQRFFAEYLANEFYKKALDSGYGSRIDFDYFGVDAFTNSGGSGVDDWKHFYRESYRRKNRTESTIKDAREFYELVYENLEKYKKETNKKQEPYSHLIDAQFAFVIALDKHRDEGSFLMKIPADMNFLPDETNPAISHENNLFSSLWVSPDEMKPPVELGRRKPVDGFRQHRSFTRDTFYADRYLPILIKELEGKVQVRVGFSEENSVVWEMKKKNLLYFEKLVKMRLLNQSRHIPAEIPSGVPIHEAVYNSLKTKGSSSGIADKNGWIKITINRRSFHDYLMKHHNTRNGEPLDDFSTFCLSKLGYRIEKRNLNGEKPAENEKNLEDTALDAKGNCFSVKFAGVTIELPYRKAWEDCWKAWKEKASGDFQQFLREYFVGKRVRRTHERARKVFSLPVKTSQGSFLIREKNWQGGYTYQIVNDADSRKVENKASLPVIMENGELGEMYAGWFHSENMVKLTKDKLQSGKPINPNSWFRVDPEVTELPKGIANLWYKFEDVSRPFVAFKLGKDAEKLDSALLIHPLCRGRFEADKKKGLSAEDVREIFWQEQVSSLKEGDLVFYKGANLSSEIKKAFLTATEVTKPE